MKSREKEDRERGERKRREKEERERGERERERESEREDDSTRANDHGRARNELAEKPTLNQKDRRADLPSSW